jgi:hypothetical protein
MRDFTYVRPRPKGLTLPKIHSLPCPNHPSDAGQKSNPKRCAECMRVQRRARFAAIGEPVGSLYASARWHAKNRGIEFTLTIHQFKALRERPCVYAYTAINGPIRATVGIDRIDSTRGYTPENSQPCCGRHNLLKSDMLTHEQTIDAVSRYRIPCGTTGAGRKKIQIP